MSETPSLSIYPDLGDRVYHLIREQILSGKMPPGSLLLGVELARVIGVSRTPVADALNVLATEGLVEIVPRKGYYVTSLSIHDYRELMDARLAIELAVVERMDITQQQLAVLQEAHATVGECAAAKGSARDCQELIRRNVCFHELLVDGSTNRYLVELYRRLSARIHLAYTHFSLAAPLRPVHDSVQEHAAIMTALAAGDLVALKVAVAEHVEHTTEFYTTNTPEPPPSQPVTEKNVATSPSRRLPWLGRNHPATAQG